MKKYTIVEVWVRVKKVKARSKGEAYDKGEPKPVKGMTLSNWHIAK